MGDALSVPFIVSWWNSYFHHFIFEFASLACLWCDFHLSQPIIPKQLYQFLRVTPIFHVSCRTLGLWNRLKNLTDLESILIRLLLFVKFINEYAHHAWNPWKSELKEHSSTPHTNFDKVTLPSRHRPLFVRHYRAKYFLTRPLIIKMCSIIVLKCKKLEGYNHVYF